MNMNMKNIVNTDDFLNLIYWVKTFLTFEGKKFNHLNLMEQVESYKLQGVSIDTTIHNIDELMIDAYKVYDKLHSTKDTVFKMMNVSTLSFIPKDLMVEEIEKFERIFEDLLENYKYGDTEIRGIQKGFVVEKMNMCVESEDYESAAIFRDKIKEF